MNKSTIHETTIKSLANDITFPEAVRILTNEGVESYRVDLVQNLKTFYMPSGETYAEKFTDKPYSVEVSFSKEGIVAAIRGSQQGKITYLEFLNQIARAGVTDYTVYIQGKKVIYMGRKGDFHVENFPGAHT